MALHRRPFNYSIVRRIRELSQELYRSQLKTHKKVRCKFAALTLYLARVYFRPFGCGLIGYIDSNTVVDGHQYIARNRADSDPPPFNVEEISTSQLDFGLLSSGTSCGEIEQNKGTAYDVSAKCID